MGSLHKGHSSLISAPKNIKLNKPFKVITSIFINPLQFGKNEDFEKYPRTIDKDCEVAEEAGASAIWAPSFEDIFPGGLSNTCQVKAPSDLQKYLCGFHRNGHFDGVATVVTRLLSLVRPEILILGEKDWQQLIILRKLISDLGLPIKVLSVATVRDENGIPYSSRNNYLTKSEKKNLIFFSQTLKNTNKKFKLEGKLNNTELKNELIKHDLKVEYIEAVDPFTLQPTNAIKNHTLLAAAVRCGNTRLIDHTFLMTRKPVVAIDGPAGAGKSTVTKLFAKRLQLIYLDTGSMYRAVTWLIQKENIDPNDEQRIRKLLENLQLELKFSDSGNQIIIINKLDATDAIREQTVTNLVSTIASNVDVRKALTTQQKQIGSDGGLVAEGRDIGTTVFPDAELKIFLTASPKERARRRRDDLIQRGQIVEDIKIIEKQIIERDYKDSSRKVSPLRKADDAIEVITDGMDIEKVVNELVELFRLNVPQEVWSSH